jgi:hypothetical protein
MQGTKPLHGIRLSSKDPPMRRARPLGPARDVYFHAIGYAHQQISAAAAWLGQAFVRHPQHGTPRDSGGNRHADHASIRTGDRLAAAAGRQLSADPQVGAQV